MSDVFYRYRGAKTGAHLLGIPARDLTEDDVKALDPPQRSELEDHVANKGGAYVATQRLKEAIDPSVPGEIDADQVVPGESPDPNIPPQEGDPAVTEVPSPVVGEPVINAGGVVQSDHL